ncbi:MAG TPA: vanadium-dependent haloperoxidase [Candidatus Limnocylindrales bacterium]|nr:vanadium-dependent haloperoxidase [Candidatus Limnocylindrales bacterium]
MRRSLLVFLLLLATGASASNDATRSAVFIPHARPAADFVPTAAYRWLEISLEATARQVDRIGARPTIISRTVAVALTAMYDAWAAYDDKAIGTRLGATLRRPAEERTDANREVAIAYATYRGLLDVYPEDSQWIREQMVRAGLDPDEDTTDTRTPAGVGNVAAQAVISYRHHDGANQLGDEVGSDGTPYSDWTYYWPINSNDRVVDPDRWQPLPFADGRGGRFYPGFLTPHWYRVRPFALDRADQFRPGPPPKVGSPEMAREVEEVMRFNASLTPQQKAIVEFMRDGPRSTGQTGHWLRFAQDVSRRDRYDLARDVKLFFAVANVAMDAFIASWESKRYYDTSRPWTLVRHYYAGKNILGWAGPGKGVVTQPAEQWHPYSPDTFVTPPFPGFTSGHSTVSAACARVLELYTGSPHFGVIETRKAGSLTEAHADCVAISGGTGQRPDSDTSCDITLELPTFEATAQMAGISRVMGGYHIQSDNTAGLDLGRKVADFTWPRIRAYFDGVHPMVAAR